MKLPLLYLSAVTSLLLSSCSVASALTGCSTLLPSIPMPAAAMPSETDVPGWKQMIAKSAMEIHNSKISGETLLFVGDSITASWDRPILDLFFKKYNPFLLGLAGDTTAGTLWRVDNLDWPSLKPSVAVLLIGTNNTARGDSAHDVALGILTIARRLLARLPGVKIIVLQILPRGESASNSVRKANDAVNALLVKCSGSEPVTLVDVSPILLDPAGHLPKDISFDDLHLTPKGYYAVAQFLAPKIAILTGH